MISRVAESCFWMQRYLERCEATTRLLEVNRMLVPDLDLPHLSRWFPMIVVAGERERFIETRGEEHLDDEEAVQGYLAWETACPVSIHSSFHWARENARTIREILSTEFWESLNTSWLWLTSGKARYLYNQRRGEFYRTVKRSCLEVHGAQQATMPFDEPMYFMLLGGQLERLGQTARLLDVRYHMFRGGEEGRPSPEDAAGWLAILRTCSAEDAFFRKVRSPLSGALVAEYLLRDPEFPRSVRACAVRCKNLLQFIDGATGGNRGAASMARMQELIALLDTSAAPGAEPLDLHDLLTRIVSWTAQLTTSVESDYFYPTESPSSSSSMLQDQR